MSVRIHRPGSRPGTGYCGARTRDIADTANCPNCAAAVLADQQAAQAREEQNR